VNHFEFGPYRLDAERRIVTLDGVPMALGPKVVETLAALVERAGDLVTKEELFERVWPSEFVEESNLTQNVYVLRKTLRAHWAVQTIATVPRRGYRFVAPVSRSEPVRRDATAAASIANPRRGVWRWSSLAGIAVAVALTVLAPIGTPRPKAGPPPLSVRGAQLYALGRYYWNTRTEEGLLKSARYFQELTRADPRSPLGYAGLAEAYGLMPQYDVRNITAKVALARAQGYVRQALALDPRSAEAHAIRGELAHYVSMRPNAGQAELELAVALNPQYAPAHTWLGSTLYAQGQITRARAELETAERLDPASPVTESWLGDTLFMTREYDVAVEHLHRALDLDPHRDDALKGLGMVEAQRGHFARALAAVDRIGTSCHGCVPYAAVVKAYIYARMHRETEARAALRAARQATKEDVSADIAFVLVALDARDEALAWLRKLRYHDPAKSTLLALDPRLDPVRTDARFSTWTRVPVSI
jgi:DNA-binding winged helix-turn-helix (wHTH) protein/tetratricopeptide (TPR) repeat protein